MNRKDFLKSLSLASIGLSLPTAQIFKNTALAKDLSDCVLIPTETAGPFPLDLSASIYYFRQDVREDRAGVQLNVKMKILGLANCLPMPNVRVNIWHCDKDGNYSGYGTQAGLTYLRGYQMTDVNGEADFITIFPGWYPGRVCHIHFQVHVSSAYSVVSQFTFDHNSVNALYAAHTDIYTKGADPLTPQTDNIFANGYQYQLATLSPNVDTGGYNAYIEVTVQGTGTVGLGHTENEIAKNMQLGQNYPNPFTTFTTIPLALTLASQVTVELWNQSGKKVAAINKGWLPAGNHTLDIDLATLRLPRASYAYQVQVTNENGAFTDCKMMTLLR